MQLDDTPVVFQHIVIVTGPADKLLKMLIRPGVSTVVGN